MMTGCHFPNNHTYRTLSEVEVYNILCKRYGKSFVDDRRKRAYTIKALVNFCESDFAKYGNGNNIVKNSSNNYYKNRFNNFTKRQYDFNKLEQRLLNSKGIRGND